MQAFATSTRELEAFSALKSESDGEHNVHSNYQSNHHTLDNLEDDVSEHTLTLELKTTLPTLPAHEINLDQ